jgi:uncharacterized membrane protein YccC
MNLLRRLHPGRYWDALLAADPGLERLRRAARATLTAGAALLLLTYLARALNEPSLPDLVGITLGMFATAVVNDPAPRQQRITMLLAVVVSAAVLVVATLLAAVPWLSYLAFVAVIFAAVFVRRFGSRASVLGFLSFMAYFVSAFLHVSPARLPWTLGSIAVAGAVGYVVRFWIVRDRPQAILRQTLRAFRARVALLLFHVARQIQDPIHPDRHRRRVRHHLDRLNDVAMSLEDRSSPANGRPLRVQGDVEAWWTDLMEIEISVGSLADASERIVGSGSLSPRERETLVAGVEAMRAAVRSGSEHDGSALEGPIAALLSERKAHPDPHLGLAFRRFEWAARGLLSCEPWNVAPTVEAAPTQPGASPAPPDPVGAQPAPDPPPSGDREDGSAGFLGPNLRQALQAMVAGGLAIVAGRLISPAKWYWAVIAAFVVFTGANTSGETLSRAWERVLGTAIGAVAGLLLAEAVIGHTDLEMAIVFVSIFGIFYFMRASYTWMVFFITALLLLLYALLGLYRPELIVLRLEETLAGAALGALAALVLFPARSSAKIHGLMAGVMRGLGSLLERASREELLQRSRRELRARTREIERDLQELRNATEPLRVMFLSLGTRALTERVHRVSLLVFSVRHYLSARQAEPPQGGWQTRVTLIESRLAQNATALATYLEEGERQPLQSATDLFGDLLFGEASRQASPEQLAQVQWLARVDEELLRLAVGLDVWQQSHE